jgi:phosphate transport system substrate-binding protein
MKMQSTRRAVLLSALCLAFAGTAMPVFAQSAADAGLTGNGSTFGAPLYGAWGKTIGGAIPGGFHYDPTNSLEGIFRFQSGLVDIGASDVPMTDEQISGTKGGGADVAQIPTAYSAIVITYNLPGYDQPLKLTGEQLAKIYLGEIQWWNDPELVANNPGLKQHVFRIITFHRADGSGTTRGFTSFLSPSSGSISPSTGQLATAAAAIPISSRRSKRTPTRSAIRNCRSR